MAHVHAERAADEPTLPTLVCGVPDQTTQYNGGAQTEFELEPEPVSPTVPAADLELVPHSADSPEAQEELTVRFRQVKQDETGLVAAIEEVELSQVNEEMVVKDDRSSAPELLMP